MRASYYFDTVTVGSAKRSGVADRIICLVSLRRRHVRPIKANSAKSNDADFGSTHYSSTKILHIFNFLRTLAQPWCVPRSPKFTRHSTIFKINVALYVFLSACTCTTPHDVILGKQKLEKATKLNNIFLLPLRKFYLYRRTDKSVIRVLNTNELSRRLQTKLFSCSVYQNRNARKRLLEVPSVRSLSQTIFRFEALQWTKCQIV